MNQITAHLVHSKLYPVEGEQNKDKISVNVEIDDRNYQTETIDRPKVPLETWQINAHNRIVDYLESKTTTTKKPDKQASDLLDEGYANALLGKLLPTKKLLDAFEDLGLSSNSRVILDVTTDEQDLLAYPWELCAHPDWKALGIKEPLQPVVVVRSKIPYQEKWPAYEPVRVLVVGVMPYGLPPVNFEKEFREIAESLSSLLGSQRQRFEIEPLREATIQHLKLKIESYQPHVIHLVTNGQNGAYYFETSKGQPVLISGSELVGALVDGKELCLFVSTACMAKQEKTDENSWGLGKSLSTVVPITIGMQIPISHEAALAFINEFYHSLAASYSILDAYTQARERLRNQRAESPEWIAPVLYRGMKSDPKLFLTDEVLIFLHRVKNQLNKHLQDLEGPNSRTFGKDVNV